MRFDRKSKSSVVTLIVAILLSSVVIACSRKAKSAFSDQTIREYAAMSTLKEDTAQGTYIAGKPVLINIGESISHHYETAFTKDDDFDIESQSVSSLQAKISNHAENPNDVGTVVLLNWRKEVLSTNLAGINFVRVLCELTVVDVGRHSIVGKKQFTGSSPEGTHRWGSSPEKEIVEYLNALPKRDAVANSPQPMNATPPEWVQVTSDISLMGVARKGLDVSNSTPAKPEYEYQIEVHLKNTGPSAIHFDTVQLAFEPGKAAPLRQQVTSRDLKDQTKVLSVSMKPGEEKDWDAVVMGATTGELLRRAAGESVVFSLALQSKGKTMAGPFRAKLPELDSLPSPNTNQGTYDNRRQGPGANLKFQ